ncbi:9844_t:CDS:1, partial [Ambispora gerdemannii]
TNIHPKINKQLEYKHKMTTSKQLFVVALLLATCLFALSDAVPHPIPEPEPFFDNGKYTIKHNGQLYQCSCPGMSGFIPTCCKA